MPNNVENVLRITGPAEDVARFKRDVVGRGPRYRLSEMERRWHKLPDGIHYAEDRAESVLDFHAMVPVPSEVQEATYDPRGYDWQSTNWGTKWNAYGPPTVVDLPGGGICYFFETAWAPPEAWLRAVSQKFRTLTFELWARDEYPYAETIYASCDDEYGDTFEVCYGEMRKGSVTP